MILPILNYIFESTRQTISFIFKIQRLELVKIYDTYIFLLDISIILYSYIYEYKIKFLFKILVAPDLYKYWLEHYLILIQF